jgi:hypothetical protein
VGGCEWMQCGLVIQGVDGIEECVHMHRLLLLYIVPGLCGLKCSVSYSRNERETASPL